MPTSKNKINTENSDLLDSEDMNIEDMMSLMYLKERLGITEEDSDTL